MAPSPSSTHPPPPPRSELRVSSSSRPPFTRVRTSVSALSLVVVFARRRRIERGSDVHVVRGGTRREIARRRSGVEGLLQRWGGRRSGHWHAQGTMRRCDYRRDEVSRGRIVFDESEFGRVRRSRRRREGGGSSSEERRRLEQTRISLRRTHNMIEHMLERDRKDRIAEAMLERKARMAMRDRGEDDGIGGGGEEDEDDVEDIHDRGETTSRGKKRKANTDHRMEEEERCDGKDEGTALPGSTLLPDDIDDRWSLVDSVLLHGTSDQIMRIVPCPAMNGGWTEEIIDSERADLRRRLRPTSSSRRGGGGDGGGGEGGASHRKTARSLLRLYAAYDVLERAARVLDLLGGTSSSSSLSSNGNNSGTAFRSAVSWLLAYASKNDGFGVRGISSSLPGGGLGSVGGVAPSSLSLSLFGPDHRLGVDEKGSSTSLASEFHRLRQCAALGSALLYLSAKRAGVGRTLAEVCSAFGSYSVVAADVDGRNNDGGVVGEQLVRPKHCSIAMRELRTALHGEVFMPPPRISAHTPSASSADSAISNSDVRDASPREITPAHDGSARGSTTTSATSSSLSSSPAVGDGRIPEICVSGVVATTGDEAGMTALADLTTRMANALDLPSCAVHAAAAVAMRCARDARAPPPFAPTLPTVERRCVEKKTHIRPIRKGGGVCDGRRGRKDDHAPDDVVAIASILLVCNAGGTMQRLACQATGDAASSSTSSVSDGTRCSSISNPLNDLMDDLITSEYDPPSGNHIKVEETRSSSIRADKEQPPWKAWSDQPSWHRDICQMERCTVIPRRAIISYYSNAIHPRRSYFLDVAGKSVAGDRTASATTVLLLRSIVAAAPLMSLRNL